MLRFHVTLYLIECVEGRITDITKLAFHLCVHSFHMANKVFSYTESPRALSANYVLQFSVHRLDMSL